MFVFLSGTGTNGNLKRNLLPGVTTTSTRKVPVPVHRNRGILTSLLSFIRAGLTQTETRQSLGSM